VGRWAERAKAAYTKRLGERSYPSPNSYPTSRTPNRKVNARQTSTPHRDVGKSGATLTPPSTSLGETSTDHPRTSWGMVSTEDAQIAYKAHKVPTFSPTPPGTTYTFVDAADKLEPLIEALQHTTIVGLDLETTGLKWWQDRIRLVSITTEAGATFVIDAFKVAITPLFSALKDTKIVAHDARFDLLFLKRAGFEPGECACTMVLSQILWAGKLKPSTNKNVEHDLASIAKRALNVTLDKSHQKEDWARELTPEMLLYAARDSVFLPKLYKELTHRIAQAG
jgi:DNA polymerase III epsilon subunit-like protein